MNRTFLLRAVISGVITLLVLVFTSLLGLWQYSQSQRDDIRNEVLAANPVALSSIHTPEEFVQENVFARRVQLQGILDCENLLTLKSQTIVGNLCLFKNTELLPIVVFLSEALTIDVDDKEVSVIGRLQPSQSYESINLGFFDDYAISEVNINALVQHFQQSLYDGFVIVQSITSEGEKQEFLIDEDTLILPPAGIELRNLFYAWQWWIFAGFALLLWLKYVRDEWQKQHETL